MKKIDTILLTGGTGFLGSNLIKRFLKEGINVLVFVRSLSNTQRITNVLDRITLYNTDNLEKPFKDHKIDTIIHCATNYGRKDEGPISMLEANLTLPLKLLQLSEKHQVPCFINTDTVLDKGVNMYSLSKSQFKDWLKVYSSKLTCVNIALEHFYGPNDDRSKFTTNIIRSILSNVKKIDLTRGEQKRDFIYIDDVVEAFVKILKHSSASKNGLYCYEIGTCSTVKIKDFVSLVKKIANNDTTKLNFGALPYRKNEVMDSKVDISAIKKLGWEPKHSLEKGLKKTIETEKGLYFQ